MRRGSLKSVDYLQRSSLVLRLTSPSDQLCRLPTLLISKDNDSGRREKGGGRREEGGTRRGEEEDREVGGEVTTL